MAKENPQPSTIADRIIEVLKEVGSEMETKELASRVASEMDSTPEAVAQEFTKLVRAGRIVRVKKGVYKLGDSVERDVITPQTAIVIWNPKTKKVWLTVEILARVRVHDRIDLEGGEGGVGPDYAGDWR